VPVADAAGRSPTRAVQHVGTRGVLRTRGDHLQRRPAHRRGTNHARTVARPASWPNATTMRSDSSPVGFFTRSFFPSTGRATPRRWAWTLLLDMSAAALQLPQAMTMLPAASIVMPGLVWLSAVWALTWTWSPTGLPLASYLRAWMLLPSSSV